MEEACASGGGIRRGSEKEEAEVSRRCGAGWTRMALVGAWLLHTPNDAREQFVAAPVASDVLCIRR